MCNPRLSYVYLSIFVSHLCCPVFTHVLLFLLLMITTTTSLPFIRFHLSRRKNKTKPRMRTYLRTHLHTSVLFCCSVFCKHINVYRLVRLALYHKLLEVIINKLGLHGVIRDRVIASFLLSLSLVCGLLDGDALGLFLTFCLPLGYPLRRCADDHVCR